MSWDEARERMRLSIDAVFWQDLSIGDPEKQRSGDWILDYIVRPEFDRARGEPTPDSWSVMRQDDNGIEFVIESGLSFAAASSRAHTLEIRGHKQLY